MAHELPDDRHADDRTVRLQLPADPRLLRVARVTVASVAAELPFTLEEVEDLRVAVDELSAALIDGCDPARTLELEISVDRGGVAIEGRVRGVGPLAELHPVALDLLGLVAPGHALGEDGDDRTFRFAKRALAAAGPS